MPIGLSSRARQAYGCKYTGRNRSNHRGDLISVCVLVLIVSVMTHSLYKLARLYLNEEFSPDADIPLSGEQAHYLRNVLRASVGERVRVFNGRDGEWLAELSALDKKRGMARLAEPIAAQPAARPRVMLLFAPIRKQRLDFLIEKAVELGVSDLYPVITTRTESRTLKPERIAAQIIEAAEQCERMDLPRLHPAQGLDALLRGWGGPVVQACVERRNLPPPGVCGEAADCAFLIGPEGGFDEREAELLCGSVKVRPVGLGETILRAETAALYCLSLARAGVQGPKVLKKED